MENGGRIVGLNSVEMITWAEMGGEEGCWALD